MCLIKGEPVIYDGTSYLILYQKEEFKRDQTWEGLSGLSLHPEVLLHCQKLLQVH